jgi:hypothetical protein
MNTPRNRPSGLAVVGYGMTLVGFVQVAVTIAPHVAQRIPAAGTVAPVVGVAVALAADIVWAALGHTTIRVAQTRQWWATVGFGAATLAAVVASTVLLAAVGHMGPWSAIPALAALLLAADGVRGMVMVSPETGEAIRARAAEIRDARAMARMEARADVHTETIAGYREATRLAARTSALAGIRVQVERAESKAAGRLVKSAGRHSEGAVAYRELMGGTVPVAQAPAQPVAPVAQGLALVPDSGASGPADVPEGGLVDLSTMSIQEKRACAAELYEKLGSWNRVAEAMGAPRSNVRRWAAEAAS